jgi:hypothetical protein
VIRPLIGSRLSVLPHFDCTLCDVRHRCRLYGYSKERARRQWIGTVLLCIEFGVYSYAYIHICNHMVCCGFVSKQPDCATACLFATRRALVLVLLPTSGRGNISEVRCGAGSRDSPASCMPVGGMSSPSTPKRIYAPDAQMVIVVFSNYQSATGGAYSSIWQETHGSRIMVTNMHTRVLLHYEGHPAHARTYVRTRQSFLPPRQRPNKNTYRALRTRRAASADPSGAPTPRSRAARPPRASAPRRAPRPRARAAGSRP